MKMIIFLFWSAVFDTRMCMVEYHGERAHSWDSACIGGTVVFLYFCTLSCMHVHACSSDLCMRVCDVHACYHNVSVLVCVRAFCVRASMASSSWAACTHVKHLLFKF